MIDFIEIMNELFKNSFVNKLTVEVVSLRLLLAVVFGGIVGYTREKDNKPAGFRTHILVCFGAAVISMVQDQLRLNYSRTCQRKFKIIWGYKNRLGKTRCSSCKWDRIFRCRKHNERKRGNCWRYDNCCWNMGNRLCRTWNRMGIL